MIYLKNQQRKKIKYTTQYILAKTLFIITNHLPFPFKTFIGRLIGKFILYPYLKHFEKRRYKIFQHNISIIKKKNIPNKKQLFKQYCIYASKIFLQTFNPIKLTPQWLKKNIKENNLEELINSHKNGNKNIIISAHFGNWELAQNYLSKVHNLPLTILYRKQNNIKLNNIFYQNRSNNIELIEKRNRNSLKNMLQSLNNNRILVILIDQKDQSHGSNIQFFNKTAKIPTAISRIAIKQNCKIFLTHCTAQNFTIQCTKTIQANNFENSPQGETKLTQEIFHEFEKWIDANPTNWYCLTHNIWNIN